MYRLERIAATAEHITVAVQVLAGAVIVLVLDVNYYQDIRDGAWFNPPWLSFAIPIVLTAIWLTVASWSVRHLWRVWREWQALRASSRRGLLPPPARPATARHQLATSSAEASDAAGAGARPVPDAPAD